MLLDVYTLQVTNALVACASVLTLTALRLTRVRPEAVNHWLAGMVLLSSGLFMLGLRGTLGFDWLPVVSNTCIVAGVMLLNRGVHEFARSPRSPGQDFAVLSGFVILIFVFTYLIPHVAVRITVISTLLIALCADSAWVLFRRKDADWWRAGLAVASVFLLLATALLIRQFSVFANFSDYTIVNDGAKGPFFLAVTFILGAVTMTLTFLCLAELSAENRLFASAIDHCSSSIVITDARGRVTYTNPSFVQKKKSADIDAMLQGDIPFRVGEMTAIERTEMWEQLNVGETWRGEVQSPDRHGNLLWEATTISPIRHKAQKISHLIAIQEDITAKKAAEEKIREFAYHDALTGLPSVRLAKDRLDSACALADRTGMLVAVLFIDLDGFKQINDTHGHDSGDELLIEVANRMQAVVRDTDTVARIGGDEFLIVLSNMQGKGGADRVAELIIKQVSQPVDLAIGVSVTVGTSIGVAFYPEHGETAEAVMKSADVAMYEVKRNGKNDYGVAA